MDQQQFKQYGTEQPKATVRRGGKLVPILMLIMLVLLILAVGFAVYFYFQSKTVKVTTQGTGQTEDIQALVKEVSKIILLPTNETPQLVTVSDPKIIGSQKFFENAKIGDKVLVFTVSKKAILYRPSEHRVIEASPVSLSADGNTNSTELNTQTTEQVQQEGGGLIQ